MIIDSSVIIAILRNEQDARDLAVALGSEDERRMSAASYVEASMVIDGNRSAVLSRRFDSFLQEVQIIVEPVTIEHARLAREAFRDFGKGRHKAGLNFGDCFVYALAKHRGEPILCKGNDFRRTDVEIFEP
ncbi:MAG TPA: type II toxin-antitoxin system VapC family toxin [Terriglobales bacterium]|nr:type II toxin-antitoxin system VapC family toxin [Terriglobales bacterium]